MRWLGILCLFLMSTAIGFYAARRIRTRYHSTLKLTSMLTEMASLLRYQAMPLEELLLQLAHHPNYKEFSFLHEICSRLSVDTSPSLLWERAVSSDSAVLPAAGEILRSLGNVLGTTDMQGQLAALELHRIRMEEAAQNIRDDCIRKEGLYRKLGVLLGAMCSVILL